MKLTPDEASELERLELAYDARTASDSKHLHLSVGRRIAEVRSMRGLTQAALAAAVKTRVQRISKIENGACNNLGLDSLRKIANALQVSLLSIATPPQSWAKAPKGRPRKPVE